MTTNAVANKVNVEAIDAIYQSQKANEQAVSACTAKERIAKLKKLMAVVLKYKPQIREAMYNDFKKHASEVDLTETLPITTEIKHAIKHLRGWMRPKKVATPITLFGTSSWIHFEPKGTVLIISPWNFPINLTICPLITAIAAGNCVCIKPSEHTPHASAIMKKIVEETFDSNEVALFEGDHHMATALLKIPFNHIFFTGSPTIGKIVMEAAAKNLSSVTLELGGKSPTIVDETANLSEAAEKIAWAKSMNNGQICISPDYLFVHESKKEAFIEQYKKKLNKFYGENHKESESYARMVNGRHYNRVKGLVEDATARGAKVEIGADFDDSQDYISPTLLSNVPMDAKIMVEEIFGPVLPIHTYKNIEEPLKLINEREKPLAVYIYSSKKKNIDHIIKNTRAGGTCINDSVIHFFNNNLPFGGVNNSGIGKSNGYFGFEAFSNRRGILKQNNPLSALKLMLPPYTPTVQKLIDLTMKWF